MRKKRIVPTTEDFIYKAKKIHGNKYDYSLVNYINCKTKIKIICPEHGIFIQEPRLHLSGCGCKKCGGNMIPTSDEFIKKAKEIHGNKYDYSLVDYINSKTNIKIICPVHGVFEQLPYVHILQKSGCPKCYGNKKLTIDEIIEKFQKYHNDKYDYTLVKYINIKTKIEIICPVHGVFKQTPNTHKTHGCPLCSKVYTDDFVKKAKSIHNDKYDYTLSEYLSAKTKLKIICKKHGVFKQIPNNHLLGKGCPRCNESKGELIIHNTLNEYNIKYITQKTFEDCKYKKKLKFDFYIEEFNLCVEYDGEQHFEIWKRFENTDEKLKLRILRDDIKNEYCINNNINLLRIKYNENIIEKINNKINYLISNQKSPPL